MNHIAVRIFDINRSKTVFEHFYRMCLTEGENAGEAYNIFEKIDSIFQSGGIPWQNCASLSVDNTNAMVGKRNSVGSRILEKNPVFIGGYPCHLAHIAASNANNAFSKYIGLKFEDVCVDCYYWFDESTQRKGKLLEYFDFCDQEYQAVFCALTVIRKMCSTSLDKISKFEILLFK